MQVVGVEMEDIELVRAAPQAIEHDQMIDQRILATAVEPQRDLAARFQRGRGARVAAGEQRDLVPESDQFLGQVRNNPLGAAIKPRGTTLMQGSDLRDSHDTNCALALLKEAARDMAHHVNEASPPIVPDRTTA